MNRTLKRPMFRIGGSTGTGITSGLDQPRKELNQGSNPYAMGTFSPGGFPGFLTSFGLNLLSTPPQGNIFQTAATAAKDPFRDLQISQARAREIQGEREFLKGETDRKLTAADERLMKEIASREKIAGMKDGDKNAMAYAEIFKDSSTGAPNLIKGTNAAKFFEGGYNDLAAEYGKESVAVEPIDVSTLKTQKSLKLFRKQNPGAEGKVFFDVASGQAVKLVKDIETGDLALIPATGVVDKEGEDMPPPNTVKKPDYSFLSPGQKQKIEDIREKSDPDFGIGFYDG